MAGELRRYAAANARARSLLAELLGRRGLEDLYGYPSAAAMLDALARTPYASPAGDLSERGVLHRLCAVGGSIIASLADPERAFLRLYLLQDEVANLKAVIRAVWYHLAWEDIDPYVIRMAHLATVDPVKLAAARDVRELVDLLAGSDYAPALRGAMHAADHAAPFAFEVAIELDYYERLWAAADSLQAADAACARALLGIVFDLLNLNWIARYRDALGLSREEVLNYTLRQGRWITADRRRALAESPSGSWGALAATPYAPLLADAEVHGFDASAARLWRFLAGQVQHVLASYPFHIGVPLGVVLAQEIEIRDLRVLLAAKSIGLDAADAIERIATVRH
jgi:V/A-type H+-transporting ATPase subunit C